MEAFAAAIVNPGNLTAIVVALMVFFTVVTLGQSLMSGEQLAKRMKSVATRREELRRLSRQGVAREGSALRRTDTSPYRALVEKLNLRTLLEDPKVVEKLAAAGFRGPKPVSTFYFFRFAMPFVLAVGTAFYVFGLNVGHLSLQIKALTCMGAMVLGYYAPNLYISNRASKRRQSIVAAFPDALDLLLISVESGMSIETALHRVAGEIGSASIELAEELSLLVAELSYLPERRMAYEGLAVRTNHPGVKAVCTAMVQAEKFGTPLGAALRVMAKENRDLRLSAAEKKAAALPAQLTVPMIVFFLPVLFVVILGPVVLRISAMQKHDSSTPVINSHPTPKNPH